MAVTTTTVSVPVNGHDVPGYLARPDSGGPRSGVVVIQEWWGLDDHIKDVTRRFAELGYIALAPDLYYGKVATEPSEAVKLAMDMDSDRAVADVTGALRYLRALPETEGRGLGMIGFCMGGRLAWQTALACDLAAASSSWYGRPPEPLEQLTASKTAFQGIFAGIDRIPVSLADDLKDLFARHGMTGETHVYPDAHHGFLNDTRPEAYSPTAAADAWDKALAFFRANGV